MAWNFDEIIDRTGTNSVKYDRARALKPGLPEDFVSMWIADMDFACPEPILKAMHKRLDGRILGYSCVEDKAYYDAVIAWEKTRHNINVSKENVVFSAGVIPAVREAVRVLTEPGDSVLVNTPGYHPFDDAIKFYGRTPVYSPLRNNADGRENGYFTFDWDDLEKKAADPKVKLFFLCSPHNPTGRVWTEEELRRVADIMFRNHVFIFCDEIWHDHIRAAKKHISFMSLFPERKDFIVSTAPSKTFNLAGCSIANLLVPDTALAARLSAGGMLGSPNPLSVEALKAAYTECADWADAMLSYVDNNLAFVKEYLAEHLPKAEYWLPEGTYLAWVNLGAYLKEKGWTDADLDAHVTAAGLFIEFGGEFIADDAGFVRINAACPRSVLEKGLSRLCRVLG